MSSNLYLSLAGLAILVVINGLSTACNLAVIKNTAREEKRAPKMKVVKEAVPTWSKGIKK